MNRCRSQQGYIFLTTLLIVTGLVVLMTFWLAISGRVRNTRRTRCSAAAPCWPPNPAVAYAMGNHRRRHHQHGHLDDAWAQLGTADGNPGDEEFDLGDSTFRFR